MLPSNPPDAFYLGISDGHVDPAVAIVRDGEVIAYAEEERHTRVKHAPFHYPMQALKYCLNHAGVSISDIAAVGVNWDLEAYSDGTISKFYENMRQQWPVDQKTIAWQDSTLRKYNDVTLRDRHQAAWRREFGDVRFPQIIGLAHHYVHAFHAALQSPFSRSLAMTIDGSGDENCTVLWQHDGTTLLPIREIKIPHSMGWVYAAFTEYLGFDAYDGEYKVMGMAAYGEWDAALKAALDRVVTVASDGTTYTVDPRYLHYGPRTYSDRFTDHLIELLGRKPRRPTEPIEQWHKDAAYAVQAKLEEVATTLVRHAVAETNIHNLCICGGVALNVKMNSKLFELEEVEDLFVQPLANDGGAAVGSALVCCFTKSGVKPRKLRTLALGHAENNDSIEAALKTARLLYERPNDICDAVAEELAAGRVVGWFQGRMEAGPRALGQRSILADPRSVANRDKVNAIIKFREDWRPFCPSVAAEAVPTYFDSHTLAPFMVVAFRANDLLREVAPAIVHVDGTCRIQAVEKDVLPRYHALLDAFGRRTGVPILLNTSFNVKGEPIVCTARDALRTFWSTGLEVLAIGDFLVRKPT
jgi:carbamoyltransferase